MSFVSFEFALFFSAVTLLFFALPQRLRWLLLLVSSYLFYAGWNAGYLILIAFSTLVDYLAARGIAQADPAQMNRRRLLLALSLGTNLGVLFIFKYFDFFNTSLAALVPGFMPLRLDVLLPVGISFYTFQSMSYTIDVYRGQIPAEKHLGIFATFIAFFPQLVAGPIERAGNMLPQFRERVQFDYERAVSGLRLILWGVFKKLIIADRLAIYVNAVYNQVDQYTGWPLIFATIFFAFQIYCDFSAYSDIAIGTARMIGFDLMLNFRQPYLATSIREFWQRWHISLSTWFRDYVYIPLGGNRVSLGRNYLNILIVFVLSGLWHGAAWTFVIWGALHGLYLVGEQLLRKFTPQTVARRCLSPPLIVLKRLVVFAFVCLAWVFFRANSLTDARYIFNYLFDFSASWNQVTQPFQAAGPFPAATEFIVAIVMIVLLMLVDWLDSQWQLMADFGRARLPLRWVAYYALGFIIVVSLIVYGETSEPFIYFQF